MGMMDMDGKMDMMMMGGMSGGAAGGGMGMDGMMKMMGMGSMPMGGAGSPAAMAMPSALPGFPGASHIYHIGATGFFLDHPEHITLTLEQQTALSQKKEQALLQQAQFQRRVEEAEQELWVLTAADQPDAAAIDTKVQQIAKLQGDQRIAFIRACGEAAKVLTDEQRKQLTGMLPPVPTPMAPAAPAMPAGGGMSDM
jgi:Spy/CpxP family protein refolding chaperone